MEKSTKPVETEKTVAVPAEAVSFAASWDVFYQDAQGLECHLQLKGSTLDDLLNLAKSASMAITEAGGKPSRRMAGNTHHEDKPKESANGNGGSGSADASGNGHGTDESTGAAREPSYTDNHGVRRCNRKLTDGSICGRPVTEKEGRYGLFWSCPNYRAHAPAPVPAQ